jgi:hypothetical protein
LSKGGFKLTIENTNKIRVIIAVICILLCIKILLEIIRRFLTAMIYSKITAYNNIYIRWNTRLFILKAVFGIYPEKPGQRACGRGHFEEHPGPYVAKTFPDKN